MPGPSYRVTCGDRFDEVLDEDDAIDTLIAVLAPEAIDSDQRDEAEGLALALIARAEQELGLRPRATVGVQRADGVTVAISRWRP